MKKMRKKQGKRKKNFEMIDGLGKMELKFIKGGDKQNTEKEDDTSP